MGSIDADFIRDETGKPYLIWKEDGNDRQQPTWIYAQELDESGTRVLGGPHRLFRNTEAWEGGVIEGAYILRRDGWFYLFYSGNACCGESCNYALGVARSKTLLGNWEKNPANPILAANDVWQCPDTVRLSKHRTTVRSCCITLTEKVRSVFRSGAKLSLMK